MFKEYFHHWPQITWCGQSLREFPSCFILFFFLALDVVIVILPLHSTSPSLSLSRRRGVPPMYAFRVPSDRAWSCLAFSFPDQRLSPPSLPPLRYCSLHLPPARLRPLASFERRSHPAGARASEARPAATDPEGKEVCCLFRPAKALAFIFGCLNGRS